MKLKSLSNKDRYGNMFSVEFFEPDTTIPMMMVIPDMPDGYNGADTDNHPGDPKGTDTVPAWLTPGENVVNAEASRIPGNQEKIDQMNEEGRQIQKAQGGPIPTYAAGGDKVDYYGNKYNKSTINSELKTLKGMNLSDEQIIKTLMHNLNLSKKEAEQALYKGEGGFIQGITDYFTMPKAPPGIEYRRMPDNSIGKFTKKTGTGGGQTYLGKLEESKPSSSSRGNTWDFSSLYNSDGGSIPPMYANQGALAEFLKAEEGLRNEAYLDSAGVPTIGYGSTYGVKMGDKLSDAQANQQLMKDIAVAEEDYNNLVDVDLNPNQQNAVKSLLFNIGGPQFANSRARAALNAGDFDTFQKEASEFRMADGEVLPGLEARRAREMDLFQTPYETADTDKDTGFSFIKSAQAADDVSNAQMLEQTQGPDDGTRGVPPVDQAPPKEEDEGFFSPQVKRFLQYPLESFGMPVPEDAPGKPVGNKLFGTESTIIKEEQAERALKYPAEFLGIPAPVDAPGVPLPNVFDLLPDQDKTIANLNEMRVNERQSRVDTLASRINENQEKGIPVSPELVAAHQEATASLGEAQQVQQKHAAEVGAEVTKTAEATAQAQTYNTETGEFDKQTEQDKYEEASGTTATQQQRDAAINAATSAPESEQPPSGDPDANKKIEEAGNTADPTLINQVTDALKGAFGDLFNPKELARMALLYTGSRLMGYSHEGSFAYGAKQYLNRVDALDAQFQKDIRDDDYLDYTEESRKEFEETRDYSVLRKKKTAVTMEKPTGNSYLPGVGKVQRFLGTDGNEYVEYEGKLASVSSLAGLLEPWDETTQGREAVAADFKAAFDSSLETGNRNNNLGAGNKGNNYKDSRIALETVKLAGEAESRYREILRQNGVSINDVPELKNNVNNAISKFVNDTIDFKTSGGKGTKPQSIRAYINAETRSVLTGVPQFAMNGASENNMNDLDDMIKKEVKDENGKRLGPKDKGYADAYETLWSATYAAYRLRSEYPDLDSQSDVNLEELVDKKREGNKKKKDPKNEWTPFTLWMSRTPWTEVQAIIEQAKLDGNLDKLL